MYTNCTRYKSITRESVWQALENIGMPKKFMYLSKICVENSKAKVKIENNVTKTLPINKGLKEGDGLLPLLFNMILDLAINEAIIGIEIFTNQVLT